MIPPAVRRRPGRALTVAVLVGAVVLVALLALAVSRSAGPVTYWDVRISNAVNTWTWPHPGAVTAWRVVSTVGGPGPCRALGVVLVPLLLHARQRRAALVAAVTIALAASAAPLLKAVVDRPRPTPPHPVLVAGGTSFPSGHALASMVLAVLVLTHLPLLLSTRPARVIGAVVLAAAVTVGCSRIALGVHYPTDVLGAWLVAIALGCLGTLLMRPPLPSRR